MKARIGSLESAAESIESCQQLMSKDLDTAKPLRKDAEAKLKNQSEQASLWIKSLIDVTERLAASAVAMGMDGPTFSVSKHEVPSAKLGVFFNDLIKKLKVHKEGRGERSATESRKLAHDTLFMVLSNIACRHPDLDLHDGFKKPPAGADIAPAKEKAASRAAKVLHI